MLPFDKTGGQALKVFIKKSFYNLFLGGYQSAVYRHWAAKDNWDEAEVSKQISGFDYRPKLSILASVLDTDPVYLEKCVRSALKQSYPGWELCLYDNGSSRQATLACLEKIEQQKNQQIKVMWGGQSQSLPQALNETVEMATGEFVVFLKPGDQMAPGALFENVKLLNQHQEADLIYSDEDRMDKRGRRFAPFFKPDWSPELLLSVNYLSHSWLIRREIGEKLGWFRQGFDGAHDYDLFLRITTITDKIFHIPRVLYHRRSVAGPTSVSATDKNDGGLAGVRALRDFLSTTKSEAIVSQGSSPTEYHLRYQHRGDPMISIIIPFKDKIELLRNCLDKINDRSNSSNFEILLVSNNSEAKETIEFMDEIEKKDDARLRLFRYDAPFNFSRINNWGVDRARGEMLLFLNNDVEVITPSWLEDMLGYAQRPEIGAVGAKLLYPDGSIQHAGVILGMGGFADHAFAGYREESVTPFGKDTWSRDYLAVTAACLMLERRKFEEIGGFDEEFVVCGSDVELCLRLSRDGYRNVYLSFVKLYHFESQTRKTWVDPQDIECSLKHYAPYLEKGDPYYNRNLSLAGSSAKAFATLNLS